ncbi:MAG: ABC transporter permease, partial [Candidatus Methanoperedens sp.]|nr:ABC transporter permease [Candidatus Methanoperedens sp.]
FESKTMDLLLVSPVSFSEILNGKLLTAIIIVPMQVFLWLALVRLNGVAVYNTGIILLLVRIISIIIVLIGALIAVKFKDRTISQYMYSLILILLFLVGYLFADSPFNMVIRLSSGAVGIEMLVYSSVYVVLALPLFMYVKRLLIS